MTYEQPMNYDVSLGTKTNEWESTVEDICDFIVEYINSDVLVCIFCSHETAELNLVFTRVCYQIVC